MIIQENEFYVTIECFERISNYIGKVIEESRSENSKTGKWTFSMNLGLF